MSDEPSPAPFAGAGTRIEVTCYTDPLSSWCWAFEGPWRRLRYEMEGRLAWRTVLGGMIQDWESYSDPLASVSRPVQMGPQWFEVRHLTGMPIEDRIWIEDPPASSYPACVAVKTAGRQGREAGDALLRRLREAVMIERRNISRRSVLLEVAGELAGDGGLDLELFRRDLHGDEALDAFREDLKEVRFRGIGRFPTVVLAKPDGPAVLVVGHRPFAVLWEALSRIAPEAAPVRTASSPLDYARHWGRITACEVAEALDLQVESAARELDRAVEAGSLARAGHLYVVRE